LSGKSHAEKNPERTTVRPPRVKKPLEAFFVAEKRIILKIKGK
jgi:hypothetical protein